MKTKKANKGSMVALSAALLLPITSQAAVLAHYGFEDLPSGPLTTAPVDSTGNTTAAFLTSDAGTGNPLRAAGAIGSYAMSFDGGASGTFGTYGNKLEVSGGSLGGLTTYTLGFWMKGALAQTSYSYPIDDNTKDIQQDGGGAALRLTGTGLTKLSNVYNDAWHHIVVSTTPGSTKAYLDGKLVQTVASTVTGTGAIWTLGGESNSLTQLSFKGLIDDFIIFDTVLTDGGVTAGQTAGGDIASLFTNGGVAFVPEPSSTALLGLGGLALILRRRK